MSDIDIHHLSAAYALDALDERERMAFEAHYPSCDVCRADVLDFRDTIAHLAEASSVTPPLELKAKVLSEIGRTRQLSPLLPDAVVDLSERRRRRRWMAGSMAAAAAIVAFVAGSLLVTRDDQPAYAAELEAVLGSADGHFVTLESMETDDAGGSVMVAWSMDRSSAVLMGDELTPAPDGQAYELWLIDDGGPVAMHVLDPASDGQLRGMMDIDAEPTAWGMTLEPVTGSTSPTGEIMYLAEL